ncbi:MAG: dihydroorotase [Flavobacteriia bacterium]
MKTILRNATLVNEGKQIVSDILISQQRIEKIAQNIGVDPRQRLIEIDAAGKLLIPGMIDDQVHFRDPGLTHKATIYSESRAAVAGGITSFMDMPNTIPNTLSLELLEEKYQLASRTSVANYSFFMGISKGNLEEALRIDNERVCGITDDGLYFNDEEGILANYPDFLEQLFQRSDSLIALHSEDDAIIHEKTQQFLKQFGRNIPSSFHSKIRTSEACVTATKRVLELAKKSNVRLHFFHVSTGEEAELFEANAHPRDKRITAEACVHHLYFNEEDYATLGDRIKWNPSIKTKEDNVRLLKALEENRIDIIATDHAPHTWEEKTGNYFEVKSGGPLVQHALLALMELHLDGLLSLDKLVQKTSHHVAELYRMVDRGYLREGYFADMVLIDLEKETKVDKSQLLYHCQWSPFEGKVFRSSIHQTWVNGALVFDQGRFPSTENGLRMSFEKFR